MKLSHCRISVAALVVMLSLSFQALAVTSKPTPKKIPKDPTADTQLTSEQHEQLDTLFEGLARSDSIDKAGKIITQIWAIWKAPGDPQLLAMMKAAESNFVNGKRSRAFDILDHATARYPGYSEIWNQRATYYYFEDRYDESLEDIAKVLELEPRHFGAMSGKMAILMRQDKLNEARAVLVEALKINPFMGERIMLLPKEKPQKKESKGQPI